MTRYITIGLAERGVSGRARRRDAEAPPTCGAVWDARPGNGGAVHAK